MKTYKNLREWQKVGVLVVVSVSLGYSAIVALISTKIDTMASITLCALLVAFGAVGSGVVVAMQKDEHASRVNYYATKRANSLRDDVANRDAEIHLLREELAESLYREKNASGDLARMREINNGLQAEHRAGISRIEVLLAKVREQEFTRLQLSKVNDKLTAQIDEQETEIDNLLQSRNDWREAYDKLRNGESKYTHSASTALVLGTLDKGYLLNGETVYPLS